MSSNIYEDPDLTMNVKYSKSAREDRGERVERQVDIYYSEDRDLHVSKQVRGARTRKHLPAVQRNPFKAAALVLGLLCLLLVVGVIVLSILNISITRENNKLSIQPQPTQGDNLSKGVYQCQTENQTQGNITEWERFNSSCYYKSTEMKNWTESRGDCQSRGADLVVIDSKPEHDFVKKLIKAEASWIGLKAEKINEWEPEWKTNEFKLEWKWVDGSSTETYSAWKTGVNTEPNYDTDSTAYIDLDGTWNQTNGGSKRWICEKVIYRV
ncbi:killer cell lectin-like receptor subfamily B member 1B allele A [Sebastes fasciatus]|uniref:killer cell lectin-like receptor subfamily B member 1B allele A n=1 Tax=Sebastes fasciatus TaxID=394691 RepID=UPI003D9F8A49